MKKVLVFLLSAALACTLFGCASEKKENTDNKDKEKVEDTANDKDSADDQKTEGVMTHAEYVAADLDTEVTVETYVQAKQSWWEKEGQGKATVYAQSEDGAYFLYEMNCSKEDYDKLETGTKIKVTGYKSEWSGEVEITDANFEILEGSYIAEPLDITDMLVQNQSVIDHQNEFAKITGMTVADSGNGAAYLYNYDGSGSEGDDLYFKAVLDNATYTLTIESYLCDKTSEVYQAVKNLKVGDTIDVEGFIYWYEGINPHITKVTVK